MSTYIAFLLNNYYSDMRMGEVVSLDQEIYTNNQNFSRNSYFQISLAINNRVSWCSQENIFLSKETELKLITTYIIGNSYQVVLQYDQLPASCG